MGATKEAAASVDIEEELKALVRPHNGCCRPGMVPRIVWGELQAVSRVRLMTQDVPLATIAFADLGWCMGNGTERDVGKLTVRVNLCREVPWG